MQPDVRGWNMAMSTAASYGHVDILRLLCLEQNSNPGAFHNRAVRYALAHLQLEAAAFLIADCRVCPDDDGGDVTRNLLCTVVECDAPRTSDEKAALVKALLARGADPNRHNHEALRRALERQCHPVLDVLIRCPRTLMTRCEFYAVLAAIPQTDAYRETIREMMQSPRFRDNFV